MLVHPRLHSFLQQYIHQQQVLQAHRICQVEGKVNRGDDEKLPGNYVCVFVPMSLNLTAGYNILVPEVEVRPLDVTGESALQYVLTAGSIMPNGAARPIK